MKKKTPLTGNRFYVYFHRNATTNEIFYVGKGYGFRAYAIKGGSKRGCFWNNYVNKYGTPIVEIFKERLTHEEAIDLESVLIKQFGRRNYDKDGILVNRTLGGDGGMLGLTGENNPLYGRKLSLEMRKKLSEAHRGKRPSAEQRQNMRLAQIGKKMSPESIQKGAAKRKGKDYRNDIQKQAFIEMRKTLFGDGRHPMLGKKHSAESKKKISEKKKGAKMSEDAIAKCKKWHIENKMFAKPVIDYGKYMIYQTMGDLAKQYSVDINTATKWLNGKTKYKRGQFEFI